MYCFLSAEQTYYLVHTETKHELVPSTCALNMSSTTAILQRVDDVTWISPALMTVGLLTTDGSRSWAPDSGACYCMARNRCRKLA
ncbi:hypothetical protein EVAR_16937_1 [Eumeta japonica]|uniref:Uncharacterized protein n=1 Tax=Eumeta variegata TaxID=151549 RepID=A0A4C1TVC4_EUMVA|nr:hypothetical protein EVAR_16937_1 [Eumeta japonica]